MPVTFTSFDPKDSKSDDLPVVKSEVWEDQFLSELGSVFDDGEDAGHEAVGGSVNKFEARLPDGKLLELHIESYHETRVDLVGLQVWRGAFLLADYILTKLDLFRNKKILELAAGTGITSLVAASKIVEADAVVATDIKLGGILDLMERNYDMNVDMVDANTEFKVQEFDFFKDSPSFNIDFDVILAADVVYNKDITKAFFNKLEELVKNRPKKNLTVIISVEKRNRAAENDGKKIESPNYDIFSDFLSNFGSRFENPKQFNFTELKLDFHQCFQCYNRHSADLHLFELSVM